MSMLGNIILTLILVVVGVLTVYWKNVSSLLKMLRMLYAVRMHGKRVKNKPHSFIDIFESRVDARPHGKQLMMAETGEVRTLQQMEELANQVAHWAVKQGVKSFDTVALMSSNHLDYPCIWLGIAKIGAGTALINNHISGRPFSQTIENVLKSSEKKILIIEPDLYDSLHEEIKYLKEQGVHVAIWDASTDKKTTHTTMNAEVLSCPKTRPSRELRIKITEKDPLIYIFTSGTTGLPKACKISQTRLYMGTQFYPCLLNATPNDIAYAPLPLYHSSACMLAFGGCIYSGATMLIRKKFSASNFTSDCMKYGVTIFQYIGELCRYLTVLPPNPNDSKLKIRMVFGNGMRIEYWDKFLSRYHVKDIVEFYAATEGNVGLMNATGKVGALGYIPRFLDFIYPLKLIKVDPDDQSKPLKDANGRYIACKANEVGLLLSEINQSGEVTRRFEGYTDSNATNAKILNDVFKKGDKFFNTGDLLHRDEAGFFYWADRVGDTFRWKGENCSTTEVSQVLSACATTVKDVVVYAVAVPNTDGKAGMAAIVTQDESNKLDFPQLIAEVTKNLPAYARPLFIRIKHDRVLPVTTTHKYLKADLVKEGFNPSLVKDDEIFYYDVKRNLYEKVTGQVFDDIMSAKLRF